MNRQRSRLMGVGAFLLVAGIPSLAAQHADVAGGWDITVVGEAYTFNMIAEIVQEGAELSGTLDGPSGERELTGTVDGNRIRFSITIESPEGDFTLDFTGELEGQTLMGAMSSGEGAYTARWTGNRREGAR